MPRHPDNPHLTDTSGNLRDYNGTGIWSVSGVKKRYRQYCERFNIVPQPLEPREHRAGDTTWIYPIMDAVIAGIDRGDAACVSLGVDFIEEDDLFPFGKILKSNTARSLRRAPLTEGHKARLRERIVTMLVAGIIPHEMGEYIKLLRVVGVSEENWKTLEQNIPRDNPYAMRFYHGLCMATGHSVERVTSNVES